MANFDYSVRFRGYDQISQVINKVRSSLDGAKRSADKFANSLSAAKAKAFTNRLDNMSSKLKTQSQGIVQAGGSFLALGYAISRPIKAAMEFESSFADVKKVVSGSIEDFAKLKNEVFSLSKTIPLLPAALNNIVAAGGRLGIPKSQLASFTEVVAKASVAFEMSAELAGQSFANLANRMSIPISKIGDLGDAINHLSDTTASTAPSIIAIMGRLSGKMSTLKIPPHLSAGVAAFADQVFVTQELAASGVKQMLNALVKTNSKLGFYTNIQKNGVEGIKDFLKQAKKMSQSQLIKTFGIEAGNAISTMANKTELLAKTMGQVGDQTKFAGSMQREFEARSKTTANQLALLNNSTNRVMITLGEYFLPIINKIVKKTIPFIESIISWAKENETLVKQIMAATFALTAMVGTIVLLKLAVLPIAFAISFLSGTIKALGIALSIVKGIFFALSFAIKLSPIGFLVTAITAVILIFQNWGSITEWLSGKVSSFFGYLIDKFPIIGKIIDSVSGLAGQVKSLFGFGDDKEIRVKINTKQLQSQKKFIDQQFGGTEKMSKIFKADFQAQLIKPELINPATMMMKNQSDVNINVRSKDSLIESIYSKTTGANLNMGFNSLGAY